MMYEPLPITDEMIDHHISFCEAEYGKVVSHDRETARAELEALRDKGCLLYDDCRSCPKFRKCCPL